MSDIKSFKDWYCDDCMEWTNERGDDCHIGHEIIVSFRGAGPTTSEGEKIMGKDIDYASAALSELGRVTLMTFLEKNYKDYSWVRFPAFVEWVGDREGYVGIASHDSVSGVPVVLDLRGPEFWEAS